MAKGKRYPNWKEKVKEWESSNKSTKIWCQENKIPYTTLCGWRNRLKKSDHNKISNKSGETSSSLKIKFHQILELSLNIKESRFSSIEISTRSF